MLLGNLHHGEDFEKVKSDVVYKGDCFQVFLIRMKEGEQLKPHHSNTDAFLTIIDGEVIFTLMNQDFRLRKGDMINFKAKETHAVRALTEAMLMLVK
jgi:quercetin dioxygenase-like cupin family protein